MPRRYWTCWVTIFLTLCQFHNPLVESREISIVTSTSNQGIWHQCRDQKAEVCCEAWQHQSSTRNIDMCRLQASMVQNNTWVWWQPMHTQVLTPSSLQTGATESHMIGIPWNHTQYVYDTVSQNITQRIPLDLEQEEFLISSKLSESGGMHRDLTVHLRGPPPPVSPWHMLLHLPESVFVNLEDPVEVFSPSSSDSVIEGIHLDVKSASLINQEEPAFVSPQHALLITVKSNPQQDIDFGFVIQLHARYQLPLEEDELGYCPVFMLPPMRRFHQWYLPSSSQDASVWYMATGMSHDFSFVIVATLLVAWAGAAVTMWEVARIQE